MWRFLFRISVYICSGKDPESWRIEAVTLISILFAMMTGILIFFCLIFFDGVGDAFLAHPLVLDIPFIVFFSWFFFYGVKQFKEFVEELKAEKHKNS